MTASILPILKAKVKRYGQVYLATCAEIPYLAGEGYTEEAAAKDLRLQVLALLRDKNR